ncbi:MULTISPECIES: hypothetical protein [unclassified Azospirillum]|uniref:hypothetical protein n=1 Tax=unclassified Azospirillum TaxID=2630922 RepID=UPI000B64CEDC|nr:MULTISPECIES: hypothetical protein [unclassified Azospirillum]SNS35762.1 hypothetical protein SAMN05880556_10474 [Azospirillum sp. RU38E]SNS54071.1 hypothetical protein SAMN05880591_10474 [Azospirillum sp. RU37A]
MPIRNEQELEQAVQEFQRLGGGDISPADADRRDNLNADIQAYYAEHAEGLRKAKPERQPDMERDSPKSPSDVQP